MREQKATGYDLIKVLPGLSLAAYDAVARTAGRLTIPFGGHIPRDVGLLHAPEMRQHTVEHLDGYLELLHGGQPIEREQLVDVVRRTNGAAGAWNTPTMGVMEANLGLVPDERLLGVQS